MTILIRAGLLLLSPLVSLFEALYLKTDRAALKLQWSLYLRNKA